jgi:AAA+ ATPase superfamily predicted ATPase
MQTIQNPFVTGGYVAPEYFCDRETEVGQLIKNIRNGNNTMLVSTRRMGKSGLIRHCFNQTEISSDYTTFFVDIYATKSLNDFVFLLSKSIFHQLKSSGRKALESFLAAIKSLRPEISVDEQGMPSVGLSIGDIKKPETSLDEIFRFLNAAEKPCIVAIDEFQQIAKYPETNTEALLRTHIQQCPQTRFIFAGSQQRIMSEMFHSAARPFFASASMIYLKAIGKQKYVEFARNHFRRNGKEITAETIEKTYGLFEGITWYIQKTLNELYAETAKGESCVAEMVDDALSRIVDANKYAYSENMFRLPEKQGRLLIAIAKDRKVRKPASLDFVKRHRLVSASSVQAAMNRLLEKEFVTRDVNGYAVYDKFFDKWLRDEY